MSTQPNPSLLLLGHPADAEQRIGLRALLPRLLERPGALLNPLFVGPVIRPELVRDEAEHAAQRAGLKLLAVRDLGVGAEAVPGVAVLTEREAGRVAHLGSRLREGVQVVVWSRRSVMELPDPLRQWIGTEGMALDPSSELPAVDARPLSAAIAGLAGDGPVRCVVRVGRPGTLQLLADEARVRLDVAGLGPAAEVAWATDDAAPALRAAVVRLPGASGPSGAARAWERVQALQQAGTDVVLVTDPTGDAALRLLGGAGPSPDRTCWVWEQGAVDEGDAQEWPELQDMLLAGLRGGKEREVVAEFSLRETPLPEVLHTVGLWQRSGTLLVYERNRLGWMHIAGGELRGARRVQERTEAGTAAEAVTRVRDMARWRDARALFLPVEPASVPDVGSGCRIPLDAAALGLGPSGGSGYASREQGAGEVAAALLSWGLVQRAGKVIEQGVRDREGGARGALLLGHFRLDSDAPGAVVLFREAARMALADPDEGGEELAMDAGLNALLVEVRTGERPPVRAWALLEEAGLTTPADLREDSGRVALVLEIAMRAGRRPQAAALARWLAGRGADDPAARRMLPVARSLELGRAGEMAPIADPLPAEPTAPAAMEPVLAPAMPSLDVRRSA